MKASENWQHDYYQNFKSGDVGPVVKFVEACLHILLAPLIFYISVSRSPQIKQVRFHLASEFMSLWPFQLGMVARRVFYQRTLARCGNNPSIRFGAIFVHPGTELGDNVLIGDRCVIGLASIGDDVMLAHEVSILSGRHQHKTDKPVGNTPRRLQEAQVKRIKIGKDVWIGAHAVVMDDIGDGAIVGAGSVVVNPAASGATVVGNPARILQEKI